MEKVQSMFEEASRLKAEGETSEAISMYLQVLELDSMYKEAAYNVANSYRSINQMDLAVQYWQKALEIDKDFIGAHINLGIALRGMGKLDDAIYHYLQVVELDDACTEAYVNLGVAHAARGARGDTRKAADYYSKAIALQPDCMVAHYNLALQQKQEGQLDAARSSFQRVVEMSPDDAIVRCQLGSLLLDLNALKPKKLWNTTKTFVKGDVEAAEILLAQEALEQKREDQLRATRMDEALEHFQVAIELEPDMAEAHVGTGLVMVEQKKFDDAKVKFEEIVERWPGNRTAQHKLAQLHTSGDPERALRAWEALYDLDQGNKDALNAMGAAYKRLGRIDDAMRLYKVANKLDPYYHWWFKGSLRDR